MNNEFRFIILLALIVFLGLGVVAQAADSYVDRSIQVGEWTIGPQPDLGDLDEMQKRGVGLVISTRQPVEMEQLDFDETREAGKRGMKHINIPVGGDEYPFEPGMLETFSAAIQSAEGPVLLHCRSGYRASVLTAAYLVKKQGVSVDQAIETIGDSRLQAETVERVLK